MGNLLTFKDLGFILRLSESTREGIMDKAIRFGSDEQDSRKRLEKLGFIVILKDTADVEGEGFYYSLSSKGKQFYADVYDLAEKVLLEKYVSG